MRKQLISFAQVMKFCKRSCSRGVFTPTPLAYARGQKFVISRFREKWSAIRTSTCCSLTFKPFHPKCLGQLSMYNCHRNFQLRSQRLGHSHSYAGLPYWRIYRQIPEIWRILKAFGYKHFGLAICWNLLAPNFLVWWNIPTYLFLVFSQNVLQCHFYARPVYLHAFSYIFICRVTIFNFVDGLKNRDIIRKCDETMF